MLLSSRGLQRHLQKSCPSSRPPCLRSSSRASISFEPCWRLAFSTREVLCQSPMLQALATQYVVRGVERIVTL